MNKLLYIFVVLLGLSSLWACHETDDEIDEYENWESRNEQFFRDTLAYANRQIAAAKAQYGEAWEEQCEWRVYPSYCVTEGGKTTWEDSIAVRIIERGTGSGCPLYTDSVRVTYAGRLIPTLSYANGQVFDHTGISNKLEDIMDTRFEVPASFKVNNVVEGFTTVLLRMHIGDYWRVFIPSNLGYGASNTNNIIPGNSTLVFDMRLKAYSRIGSTTGPWKTQAAAD